MSQAAARSEPTFFVLVQREGSSETERIDARRIVMSFEYQDEESKADLVKLVVQNNHLKNFDKQLWAPGNIIQVAWGYVGNMAPVREAKITKVSGAMELTVEAQGKESDMNRITRRRRFENMTRGQVAAKIAEEHGFPEASQFVQYEGDSEETIVQGGETDTQFLRRLAAIEGYEFFADVDGFHFHKRQLGSKPVKEVRWYLPEHEGVVGCVGDVISWNVESNVYGTPRQRPGKIVIRGRDPGTKKSFEVVASDRDTERETLAALPLVPDGELGETTDNLNNAKEDVRRTSLTSETAAKREVDGEYRKVMMEAVELSMVLVGDPFLRAKSLVAVSGISKRLAGLYYVTSCRHVIGSSGYTTELKLKSDGVEQFAEVQASKGSALANAKQQSKGATNKKTPPEKDQVPPGQPYVLQAVKQSTADGEVTRYYDTQGNEIPSFFVDPSQSFVFGDQ